MDILQGGWTQLQQPLENPFKDQSGEGVGIERLTENLSIGSLKVNNELMAHKQQ